MPTPNACSLSSRLAFGLVLLAAPGCPPPEPGGAEETELVVFAAASLRDAFDAIRAEFLRANPGVRLHMSYAGTQELRRQLEHGAAADVFASADLHHMQALTKAGRVEPMTVFAQNEPVVVLSRSSSSKVASFAELPSARRIIIGTKEVPIGRYTLEILDRASAALAEDFRARIEAKVVSRELNVRQILAKVSLGEADAGFVYRTDVASAPDAVQVLSIPPELNIVADYPIAIVRGAAHPRLARRFVELVLSPAGQGALQAAGFVVPALREADR